MSKILPAAGVLLLTIAALLPFRASSSKSASAAQPLALAITQPFAGVAAWRTTRPAFHEPGVLLFVGGGLMGLGSWLRRVTVPRDGGSPDP